MFYPNGSESPPRKNVNTKIKLALVAASAASAAASIIGQTTTALAGPQLDGTKFNNYAATANYALQAGQSISITGNNNSFSITPFAVSDQALPTSVGGTGNSSLGNAGTSILTAAFDQNGITANGFGFSNTATTGSAIGAPSFAVQAGVINQGGQGVSFGITTGANVLDGSGTKSFNTPTSIVLNQVAGDPTTGAARATLSTGFAAVALFSNGSGTTVGVSTSTTTIGASATSGSISDQFRVVNTLTAF
jgi:hypothetical protein